MVRAAACDSRGGLSGEDSDTGRSGREFTLYQDRVFGFITQASRLLRDLNDGFKVTRDQKNVRYVFCDFRV
jgi:hypothetical protein